MAGDFFDQATISVKAGNGGDGWRLSGARSSCHAAAQMVVMAGAAVIYLQVDPHLNTLLPFQHTRRFEAERGGNGASSKRHGKNGADLTVRVPPGTVVRTVIDDESYEIDLPLPGMRLVAARGGKGGLGNVHFATSTYQVPRISELGEPGQELELELELKLLADVGLVGFPNAGKSTLLSVISAATPKIAPYPFTTLQPNLGVAEVGDFSFVVADIPGLIEGAHRGVGLGFDFLRHVERTRLLIHLVDAAGVDGRDPVADYHQILEELRLYQPELAERPRVVALNKADLPEAQEHVARLRGAIELPAADVFLISAATRDGLGRLMDQVAARLAEMPMPVRERREETLEWPTPEVDANLFTIEREGHGWRVRGKKIERLIAMTNFAQADALQRIQRVLEASKISNALIKAGIKEGETVYIEKADLLWSDELMPE